MAARKKRPDDVRHPFLVRLSPREKAVLERQAHKHHRTISEEIRQTLADGYGRKWPRERSS